MSVSLKVEVFNTYKELKEKNAPQELLDKAIQLIQNLDSGVDIPLSREEREIEAVKENEALLERVAEVDSMLEKLVSKGAPEELIAKGQELRRIVADPLDVTEEIRAVGGVALEGLTAGIVGDEARAFALSKLTGVDYETQLAEERRIEEELFEQHPALAYTTLIGTSLIPSSMLMKMAGVGKTLASGAVRQGGVAFAEGAVYGFMEGEGDFAERTSNALKTGIISGGIGATVGGFLGRAEGRASKAAEEVEQQLAKEKRARDYLQGKLTEEIDGKVYKIEPQADEVILAFQGKMDDYALKYFNETGKSLEGLDYGKALQAVSDELGVPIKKLRASEAVSGKTIINFDTITEQELRKRLGTLADDVGFVNGKYDPNKFVKWFRNYISSAQIMGEKYVGKRFGASIQRVASTMARRHAVTENVLRGSNTTKFFNSIQDDVEATRLLLNMSQIDIKNPLKNLDIRKQAYEDLVRHIKTNYGDEALQGFEAIRSKIRAVSLERKQKLDSSIHLDDYYWPSQMKGVTNDGFLTTKSNKKTNTSAFEQTRDQIVKGDPIVQDYVNPSQVAVDWLRRADSEMSLIDVFKLKNINTKRQELRRLAEQGNKKASDKLKVLEKRVKRGDALFDEVRAVTKLEGADSATADKAQDLTRSLIVMGSRGPSGLIANARKAAYMGTIANPYSAILNIGDVFNSIVNYGADNTVDVLVDMIRKRGVNVSVEDVGLAQQTTGEFIREGVGKAQARFNKLSEEAFKLSGFRDVDRFGKNVALRAGIKEGQQLARSGKLREKWGHAFTDNELDRLTKDLLQGKKTNLTIEFAAAQLARLQPSDMAQLPKFYLDNPNWRVAYMLRTFAIKQLEQMEKLVVQEWKAGNKKEAVKNGMAYSLVVGGGNAFINEGRHILKGEEPSIETVPMRFADHMLGAVTLNTIGTYQLARATGGDVSPLVSSVAPAPLSMAFAPLVDMMQFGFGSKEMDDFLAKSESVGWLPFGRLAQDWIKDQGAEAPQ